MKQLKQDYDAKTKEDNAKRGEHEQVVAELQKEVDELLTTREQVCTNYLALRETHQKLAATHQKLAVEVASTRRQQSTHTSTVTVNLERSELVLRTYRLATRVNARIKQLAGLI